MSRLIVGITGASGAIYSVRLLEVLRKHREIETHLVVTGPAERTIAQETDYSLAGVRALADVVHNVGDIGASIASGSFRTLGMVVAPCSIHTVSAIAAGISDNLLVRAADVALKEGRKLVLLVRETPLHTGHLRSMLAAAQTGAVIMPPVPAFYHRPRTIEEIIDHTVSRVLDRFDIAHDLSPRWGEPRSRPDEPTGGRAAPPTSGDRAP